MAGLTVKQTPLKGPGGYTTTTPTLSPGAGELKVFGAGIPDVRKAGTEVQSRLFQRGHRHGSDPYTSAALKRVPRTIVP
jgi:hypothetical protein